MARRFAIAALIGGALVVLAFWRLDGLLVYLALAVAVGAFVYAFGSFGDWLQVVSRRRFDDHRQS
jgi:hypothetical protein